MYISSKHFTLIAAAFFLLLALGIYLLRPKPEVITKVETRTVQATPQTNSDGSISLPANFSGWYAVGSGSFSLEVHGSIDYGGETATADTSRRVGMDSDLAPGVAVGVVVAKVGKGGSPFKVGSYRKIDAGNETLYIAINDSHYDDNRGEFRIYKR